MQRLILYQKPDHSNLQPACANAEHPAVHPAEIVERRRQADGGLAAVSAAADFSARLHADLTYTFPARNVHEVPLPGCTLSSSSAQGDQPMLWILANSLLVCVVHDF
jgi:hypothetical protein